MAHETIRNTAAARTLGAAQVVGGGVLLAAPEQVARWAIGRTRVTVPAWLVRALGARMTVQGAVEAARPTALVTIGSLAVDGLHALSMVGVAAVAPRYRRVAVIAAIPALVAAARGAQILRGLESP